jgi:glucokinase
MYGGSGVEMVAEQEAYIGLDLGGTFLKYALGRADGTILVKSKRPSQGDEGKTKIFANIFIGIEEMLAEAAQRHLQVVAIGMGSPGAVDFDHCRLLGDTPNLPGWGDAEIRKEIAKRWDIPIWADNDANVAALAEVRQGAAKGHKYVIAITLGTGIGGGVVINDQIFRGSHYCGTELGHMSIDYNGLACGCGGVGCIEAYASAPAMVRNYVSKLQKAKLIVPAGVNTEMIFNQAAKGEETAMLVIDETCEYLGAALASFTNIFNPEIYVIGGGVADAGDEFMTRIWNALKKRAMAAPLRGLKLERAQLGNDAGVVGAISLAVDALREKRKPENCK